MMKHFTLFLLSVLTVSLVHAQNNVTFQVDMNQYSGTFTTPEVNGDFNGWCGNCNTMTDANSDGIWEVTLPLTQDSIEYKFAHDNWAGQENLTQGSGCTKTTAGFTNRFIHITGDTTLPAVCWESCIECGTPPDTAMVTFQLDMNKYTGAFTTPEVNGDFNGWCGNCNAMADTNNDGIWSVTLPLTQDSIEYKFSFDTWTGQETLSVGLPCTKTTAGFTNRFLEIFDDIVLPPVCWESCMACPPDTFNVTFQVDMSQYTGSYTTPEVNGTFNGWCGNCNAMTDADNDSIWEVTLPLPAVMTEWKFSHDNWAGQESLTEGDTCTITTGGFTNRYATFMNDTTLPAVCWESCFECVPIVDTTDSTIGINDGFTQRNLQVYPNPANSELTVEALESGESLLNISLYNTLGQTALVRRNTNSNKTVLNVSSLEHGVYMLIVETSLGTAVSRVVISK